jgi:hypothetical protein
MSFTCPRCGRTSHNPTDEAEGYCGSCHGWTGSSEPWPVCLECLTPLPRAKNPLDEAAKPAEGDISICLYCGAVAIFTGHGPELREATNEDLLEALKDPEVVRFREIRGQVMGRGREPS